MTLDRPALYRRFVLGLLLLGSVEPVAAKIVHRERSLYQTVLILEESDRVCMQFSVRRDQRNQSCINPRHPEEMQFPYTRMMMTALAFTAAPERILVVGLGGGTLPEALEELYPAASLDVVEIDPVVVKLAEQYFAYQPGPTTRVHVMDARVFTKRALRRKQRATTAADSAGYDLIMLDAFNGDYIPEHLLTREYLEENRALLAPGGIVVANTFAASRLYDHESATYAAVFGSFLSVQKAYSGNRILLTGAQGLTGNDRKHALEQAGPLASRLTRYGIDLLDQLEATSERVDWDRDARVLTDQYSPANLLRGRKRRTP